MQSKGSNLERIRNVNINAILNIIYEYGPISRREIADHLLLTPPAITINVAPIIASGLLYEIQESKKNDTAARDIGRPRVLLDFKNDAFYALGVDIGPYATYICITDIRGNSLLKKEYPVCPVDYDEAVDFISSKIKNILSQNIVPIDKLAGICLGIPGFVDTTGNFLRYGSVFKWKNKNIGQDVSKRIGFPCIIENNARCRALSEEMFGSKHLPDSYIFLLVARGIGCQLKVGKKSYYTGAESAAGEIGHMVLDRKGPICPTCGNHGCLESFSSEIAIKNNCISLMKSGKKTLLSDICTDSEKLNIQNILLAEKRGDIEVLKIVEEAMINLGIAIANAINLLNPPLVLVDAYIMKEPLNREFFMKSLQKNLFGVGMNEVEIKFVEYDKFRTAIGAAARVIQVNVLKEIVE